MKPGRPLAVALILVLVGFNVLQYLRSRPLSYAPLVSVGSYVIAQDTHLGDRVPH